MAFLSKKQKESKGMVKLRVLFSMILGFTAIGLVAPFFYGISIISLAYVGFLTTMALFGFLLGVIMQFAVNAKGLRFIQE